MICFKRIIAGLLVLSTIGASIIFDRPDKVYAYNSGIETFVNSLYADCLGRTADPTGFNEWCSKLTNGEISGKEAAYGFFFSPEFTEKAASYGDSQLINVYYKVFLNREADSSGESYWRENLAGAREFDVIILFNGFAESTEFAQKCASYGITPGNRIDLPEITVTRSQPVDVNSRGNTYAERLARAGADENWWWCLSVFRANSAEELDAFWTSKGYEIWNLNVGNGVYVKCYVMFFDTTAHNNYVNEWRNQNGLPSLNIINDPNDHRYQYVRQRAVEVAYDFIITGIQGNEVHHSPRCRAGECTMEYQGENCAAATLMMDDDYYAFGILRADPPHNANMLNGSWSSMSTAACRVLFVSDDGLSIRDIDFAEEVLVQNFYM